MHKHLESHLNNYRVKIAQRANCHDGRENLTWSWRKSFLLEGTSLQLKKH